MNFLPLQAARATRLALVSTLVFAGCSGVGDTLKLKSTVLVKVPIQQPIAKGNANGWEFRHVLEAPRDERRPDPLKRRTGQWYVAWNNERPLKSAFYSAYWQSIFSRAPEIADATKTAFGAYAVLIEPNRTFTQLALRKGGAPKPANTYGAGSRIVVNKAPMSVWPSPLQPDPRDPRRSVVDPLWHLDDAHTQLASARKQFSHPGEGIGIGHLDNGYEGMHGAAPMSRERGDFQADAVGLLKYAQDRSAGKKGATPPPFPENTGASHGLGTMGILAGSWVKIVAKESDWTSPPLYEGWLGGAPYAHIVPVRVAPWVISLSTGELAYALDYASRKKHCDVITMSHGGAPTQAWADAVNAAYERGTAMFAAEGDFLSLVPRPFMPRGIFVPASPVYPAAFRRVMGVTAVDANNQSYGTNSFFRWLRAPWQLMQWMARGSYGADGTCTALLRPSHKPDSSEVKRLGELRPHPIAAYGPNVGWISVREKDGQRIADGIDLDGSGTSAATPQVAAAAALWLQKHRGEFSSSEWRSWQKAEAVYQALLKSADPAGHRKPDRYVGAGVLKARDALRLSYADIRAGDKTRDGLRFGKAPNDFFDGARSVWSVFGLQTLRQIEPKYRLDLEQQPAPGDQRPEALARLYYNLMLLREWHGGDLPSKRHEQMYKTRATHKAEQAPPPLSATRAKGLARSS